MLANVLAEINKDKLTMSVTHRSKRNLLRTRDKRQPTRSEEKARNRLGRRARRHNRANRAEPDEKVRHASHNRKGSQKIAPELMDLNLEPKYKVILDSGGK